MYKLRARTGQSLGSHRLGSIVATVGFLVAVVGDGIEQAENVNARFRIEAVHQDGVSGAIVANEFQLRIINGDVAVIFYAKLGANLQNNFGLAACGHRTPPEVLKKHGALKALASLSFDDKAMKKYRQF